MSDWYSQARAELIDEVVAETGLTAEQFQQAYAFLNEIGLIDYDIEKEVLYDRYIDIEE